MHTTYHSLGQFTYLQQTHRASSWSGSLHEAESAAPRPQQLWPRDFVVLFQFRVRFLGN